MPEGAAVRAPRSFWSGTIAFGLVSLPVNLYVANRGKPVSLRMLDEDGTPLERRYICPAEDRELSGDEIVRGYEIEKDRFVIVEDDELEGLAPEKSQEIDLRRFVPVGDIDPVYFQRAYFLLPDRGALKAYRLLAEAMEDAGKAGLATFVMRGKEYLIAILAEHGVLRAETLRFGAELRTPEMVGLPDDVEASDDRTKRMTGAMRELFSDALDPDVLADRESQRIMQLAEAKLEAGEGVVPAPEELEVEEEDEEVVDIMQLLKESLGGAGQGPDGGGERRERTAARGRADGTDGGEGLRERTKAELYEQARELDIPGRSGMSKDELIEAIREPRGMDRR